MPVNKNIFLICKEHYTYPMLFMARKLEALGINPILVFVHFTENYLDTTSYQTYKKHFSDIESIVFSDVYEEYLSIENYRKFEEKTVRLFKELNIERDYWKIRASSQMLTSHEHYRFYFKPITNEKINTWIYLNTRKVQKLLSDYKPLSVLDIDNSELVRSIIYSMTKNLAIDHFTLESTRIEDLWIPTDTFGRAVDHTFREFYMKAFPTKEEIEASENYRKVQQKSVLEYKNHGIIESKNKPITKDIKILTQRISHLFKKWYNNRKKVGLLFRRDFVGGLSSSIAFFIICFFRKRYLLSSLNKYFSEIPPHEEFILFPLHLIPESTTSVKTPLFLNEIDLIKIISRALPPGIKLFIKEHGAMIGERPLKFYKEILKIPSVKLLTLDQFDSSIEWISRSNGVITFSGTSAMEAAFIKKPSLVLSDVPFQLIPSVTRLDSLEDLPKWLLRTCGKTEAQNSVDCAKYIATARQVGIKWPMHSILKETKLAAQNGMEISKETDNLLEKYIQSVIKNV